MSHLPLRAPAGPVDLDALVAALSSDFSVETGRAEAIRCLRLDTFDHRLRGAGLALEHRSGPLSELLVLERAADLPDLEAALGPGGSADSWPAMADELPTGLIRDAVAKASGIRALTVLSDERRRLRRLDLRNRDEKVVVRLEVDEPVRASRRPGSTAWVVLQPLRGYAKEADRAARLLGTLGFHTGDDTVAEPKVLAVSTTGVSRATPALALLALEMRDFLAVMRENLPGLLDDIDTEFLHDFRVAVRRTRSVLKLGRTALPPEAQTRWAPAFKWLGDLTTPVRDLDVYELALPTMAGWLVAADPAHLDDFAKHLRRKRSAARRSLARGLRSARYQTIDRDWGETLDDWLADEPPAGDEAGAGLTAGHLADEDLWRAYRRVSRLGNAITPASPPEALHTLRKRCKELRYALEVFSPVTDDGARKEAVTDLKGLQDVLGRYQDSEVQRVAVRGFAEEMMAEGAAAQTVLAMGELVGHLDGEQNRARTEFGAAFRRFARPASDRRLRQLGGRS